VLHLSPDKRTVKHEGGNFIATGERTHQHMVIIVKADLGQQCSTCIMPVLLPSWPSAELQPQINKKNRHPSSLDH
jgi:hypothetical protein